MDTWLVRCKFRKKVYCHSYDANNHMMNQPFTIFAIFARYLEVLRLVSLAYHRFFELSMQNANAELQLITFELEHSTTRCIKNLSLVTLLHSYHSYKYTISVSTRKARTRYYAEMLIVILLYDTRHSLIQHI